MFHRLRNWSGDLHEEGEMERSLLFGIDRDGPQTVPDLARARGVSRQHVQVAVNALEKQGILKRVANPTHQRSMLVRLTLDGKKRTDALLGSEAVALAEFDLGVSAKEIEGVAQTLRDIRQRVAKHIRKQTGAEDRKTTRFLRRRPSI
ncbi:MAG: helix-turn-helix domain-containing protein [Bryobacteraceae bacterium]